MDYSRIERKRQPDGYIINYNITSEITLRIFCNSTLKYYILRIFNSKTNWNIQQLSFYRRNLAKLEVIRLILKYSGHV